MIYVNNLSTLLCEPVTDQSKGHDSVCSEVWLPCSKMTTNQLWCEENMVIMMCRKKIMSGTLVLYNPMCRTDMHSSEVEYFHFILLPAKSSVTFKHTSEMHSEKKELQKYMKLSYILNRFRWFLWNINSHIQQFSLTLCVISIRLSLANQTAVPNPLTSLHPA